MLDLQFEYDLWRYSLYEFIDRDVFLAACLLILRLEGHILDKLLDNQTAATQDSSATA